MALTPKSKVRQARALWLSATARRLLRVVGISVEAEGPVPPRGLLVSNHLSYLDILVIASVARARFISKSEVARWPVFGFLAQCGGTIFVNREQRSDSSRVVAQLRAALEEGDLLVLFPEGTSSGGETVLPFKSSLLEPASGQDHPVSVACVSYTLPRGSVTHEVCYWGDMTLGPHLLNLLRRPGITAHIQLAAIQEKPGNRKDLARHLHAEVLRLKKHHSQIPQKAATGPGTAGCA